MIRKEHTHQNPEPSADRTCELCDRPVGQDRLTRHQPTASGLEALKEWATEPPAPRAARDELVLKAYSSWLAEPDRAVALFREEERRHKEQLLEYERIRAWMEKEWGKDVLRTDSPRFASYAALRRGILNERGYAEWCRWVANRLQKGKGSAGRR